jgi:hypothetical protein
MYAYANHGSIARARHTVSFRLCLYDSALCASVLDPRPLFDNRHEPLHEAGVRPFLEDAAVSAPGSMALLATVGALEVSTRLGTSGRVGSAGDEGLGRTLGAVFIVELGRVSVAAQFAELVLGPADRVVVAPDVAFSALRRDFRA